MIDDQPVSHHIDLEALKEVGAGLSIQEQQHLNFDIKIGVHTLGPPTQ